MAEAGADRIIAILNEPENRRLLVAGSNAPSTWTTAHSDANPNPLQSPCVSSQSTRPGSNDGVPTALAVNLKDGNFRNLVDNQVNTGTQRFRLRAVRYSTGPIQGTSAQVQDRRSITRTFSDSSSWNLTSQAGTLPSGANFQDMLNLDDPDGSGSLQAGNNGGFIALTVEGRVYRPDGTFSSFTTTREFEVYAKCCGGAFGGNNTTSLGSDRRFCGVEFGLVVGINGGRFFSQASNDRYTMRNTANQVVNLAAIVGVVANPTHNWQRAAIGPVTAVPQIGCRTVPGPCTTTANSTNQFNLDRVPGDTILIGNYLNPISPMQAGSVCWPGVTTNNYGDVRSVEGRAASCVPFAPIFFNTGLPSIASRYTYNWTTSNTDSVSRQVVTSDNIPASYGGYPSFIINGAAAAADSTVRLWFRANRSNQLANATGNPAGLTPYLEYCNTKYLPNNSCASVFQTTNNTIHSWAVVSSGGLVSTSNNEGIAIGDSFANAADSAATVFPSYRGITGSASGSTPRWPSIWTEQDINGLGIGSGDLQISGDRAQFDDRGPLFWATNQASPVDPDPASPTYNPADPLKRPAIARAVNLYALRTPVLEFTFRANAPAGADTTSALRLDLGFDGTITTDPPINTDTGWQQIAAVTANGATTASNGAVARGATAGNCESNGPRYTCRIQLPAAVTAGTNRFSHWVKFRLRADSDFGNGSAQIRDLDLENVQIKSWNASTNAVEAPSYLNWCEYSSISPVTANFTGGFHCLGPAIDMRAVSAGNVSSNRIWMDTTDASITFYYNRSEDTRGIRNFVPAAGAITGVAGPLILLSNGAGISNVMCTTGRGTLETDPLRQTTAPVENCVSLVPENVFNPVGEYDRFNIFGRDTAPSSVCMEFNVVNRPCMQIIAIGADSSTTSTAGRARIAGAWIYMPWGLVGFRVNGCGTPPPGGTGIPSLSAAAYYVDDSWNYGGRLWARSVYACGQNHFRVPPSSSANLSALVGSSSTADIQYVGWTGVDWMARATSGQNIGSLN